MKVTYRICHRWRPLGAQGVGSWSLMSFAYVNSIGHLGALWGFGGQIMNWQAYDISEW